jgi:hypothetical protein
LPNIILAELNKVGYVLLKNYPTDFENPNNTILEISSEIGNPVSHDQENTFFWDIKLNLASKSNVKTYSEHNHEATLHTDSQYSFYPEDYFSLLCLKKANCGGGISYLLSLQDIIDDLQKLPLGKDCIKILTTQKFPFVVPSVFSKEKASNYEFNYGYILQDNEIRFRVDIIEKALELNPDFQTQERLWAFQILKNTILTSVKVLHFHLEENDVIFINNKTMLHGRSSFTDSERHLLRVRMNKNNVA